MGAGQFQYRPTGSPWTFTGDAGISANGSGFTSGNPPAPEGVAGRLPPGHRLVQPDVAGWAAGSYTLSFYAAQRGNCQASRQDFSVLVDGVVVGTFTPSGTSYQGYTTAAFTVAAGSHTIAFQGLDSAGGDNTAFVDAVAVVQASRAARSATRASSRWRWAPASSGTARPARPGPSPAAPASRPTAAASPRATRRRPQGAQVAFLQGTGSFSQAVAGWAAGSYTLSFSAAQRGNCQASRQDFSVLVDGVGGGHLHALGHVVPELHHRRVHRRRRVAHDRLPGPGQRRRRQHRLRRPVAVVASARPRRRSATRASSRWRWGPASSGTARPARPGPSPATRRHLGQRQRLHRGQPAGPGGHAGRLPPGDRRVQPGGRRLGRRHLRARPSAPPSGATTRRRSRTSRCWSTASVVGTFTPSGTSYRPYTTAAFTVTAGSHTIAFQGLDSAGGDNTAFVDAVAIAIS